MGRIGQAVSSRAIELGVNINYHNRKRLARSIEKKFKAKFWPNLNELLMNMDIISIHCLIRLKHFIYYPKED